MKLCSSQIQEHLTTGHHDNTAADSEKTPKHIVLLSNFFSLFGKQRSGVHTTLDHLPVSSSNFNIVTILLIHSNNL